MATDWLAAKVLRLNPFAVEGFWLISSLAAPRPHVTAEDFARIPASNPPKPGSVVPSTVVIESLPESFLGYLLNRPNSPVRRQANEAFCQPENIKL